MAPTRVAIDAGTPTPYNLTLTSADTEYSQTVPSNCRRFEVWLRTNYAVRLAFATGKVAGPTAPYLTLAAGMAYDSGPISQQGSPSTIYAACATAGQVLEILVWT